ncbi:MAG: carboxypeptidase [Flavobacteriaceae bacterium]|jgi:carboxypeptidase C (cathepsin A)|nr:MAG: carboxypeptidase [Polaribacter sp. BACL8 MAG-120531-bin13]KRP14774.1 MAG: carboxypeptidase [Polaribacter sp. BACL8 MAG-120419-bin8]MBT5585339.1 carboxypeptidase [Flavobacteriaceae bacterium]NQV62611.1 carboxypeptidase [Cryomorphaceae bacterium]MBT5921707.1 carboxypeptidase [Flavobacteriaceae bacterium]|tara:strand:- start:8879 stop:10369 length:1491 start_codon:yes stop_codon:yes gene_type:complete
MKIKALFLATLFASVSICWSQTRTLPVDTSVTTKHKLTTQNDSFNYTATTGTQPVWDENGDPIASLHYTYYTKDNVGNRSQRPLVISFNGGPGSGSVWMHLAYTGPRVLNIDTEGYPVQPYGIANNPYSILDVADIVYVNPVNTGYSRTIPASGKEVDRSKFFGVNADIAYLAEWLNTFVTRNNRWSSPKYLIGESYGTTRVSGLALALQNNQWMYLNGVILVSPTELGINREGPVEVANRLPYFAAAAWYQKKLPNTLQNKPLKEVLEEVEAYTINTVLPAMVMGGFLATDKKEALAEKMGYYSGIKPSVYLDHNLEIPYPYFWKELLREDGYTVGRLDSRYLGIDRKRAGDSPDYNSELTSWLHSFTPAINYYLQEELNFKTDIKYNMFGPVRPWDRSGDNTGENLRQAMAQNPYLHVMTQSGYFDGATTYFNAKYNMWQLDPSGRMKNRLSFKGYESGHMMYLRREDLKNANEDIRQFIKSSLPGNKPAKYTN